jgi:DNA-binding transcriptional ArsR family regulator/predicted O-methyltransferase YrrM
MLAFISMVAYIQVVPLEIPPSSASTASVSPSGAQRWELYRVLSEPLRLRLLALALEEELAVGELAELLGESQPNVSRHASSLKQAGLLVFRRHGTRTLLRTSDDAKSDPVVADALASGRALCVADGSLAKIADVLRARDTASREFFSRANSPSGPRSVESLPSELAVYLAALGHLLPGRGLAIDAGTGDGGLLDVLAPVYERVVAIDRSEAQLARARERAALRGYKNVSFVEGELDDAKIVKAAGEGADAVFAVRLLHHAPRPAKAVERLADLCRPGGMVLVLDYAPHEDESMREQADLWLGFEPAELTRFARDAGLLEVRVIPLPPANGLSNGQTPDSHLPFQLLVATKIETQPKTKKKPATYEKILLHSSGGRVGTANGKKAVGHG